MAGIENKFKFQQWLTLFFILFTVGCQGQPVPVDKKEFVGYWYGTGMKLLITSDGVLSYERRKDNMTTTVDAPILEITSGHITAGVWIFSTEFKIDRAPYQDGDATRMVIDGVTLTQQPEVDHPMPETNPTPGREV